MKDYLASRQGQKLGIIRAGMPKEVYFEAKVKEVRERLVLLENEAGEEIALPLDKILLVGPPEKESASGAVGFKP